MAIEVEISYPGNPSQPPYRTMVEPDHSWGVADYSFRPPRHITLYSLSDGTGQVHETNATENFADELTDGHYDHLSRSGDVRRVSADETYEERTILTAASQAGILAIRHIVVAETAAVR